jgi:GT2 family glycosyltransferase
VSKAYNEAAYYAEGLKKKWMLLLDQDTYQIDEFILKLPEAIQQNSESLAFVPVLVDKYSPVSPFRWSLGRGIRTKVTQLKLSLKKFRFMNSGLFIKTEAFQNAYGYPESIPLDFSDIAFGERLKMVTDHFVVIPTELRHSFSTSEKMRADAARHRYHYFCVGAFAMGEEYGPYLLYYLRAFLRGLKLSVKFKHAGFLKVFYLIAKW